MKLSSLVLAAGMIAVVIMPASAGWGCRKAAGCGESCATGACRKICRPKCKTVKEDRKCWEYECEDVCIPPVAIPDLCECLRCATGQRGSVGAFPWRRVGKTGCTAGGCGTTGCAGNCGNCRTRCTACAKGGCAQGLLKRMLSKCSACKVRSVKKLKSKTYEVEKCVVEWEVKSSGIGCGKSCASGCTTGRCAPCGE